MRCVVSGLLCDQYNERKCFSVNECFVLLFAVAFDTSEGMVND